MELIKIENINGELFTSSRNVSYVFGKDHHNVLKAIDNLQIPNDFREVNFNAAVFIDDNGEKRRKFLITENGISILVMGFTGKRAMEFKLKYIAEFNRMKNELNKFPVPKTLGDALQLAADQAKQIEEQTKQIEADKPHVDFSKSIESSSQSIKIGNFAKVISKEEGLSIGRNRLFAWMRNQKILQKDNLPYQTYIDRGWFEVKESAYLNADQVNLGFTTLITGKGQIRLLNKLKAVTV